LPALVVPRLTVPCLSVAPSVRSMAREHGDDAKHEYREGVAGLRDDELPGYVDDLLAEARERRGGLNEHGPSTHLWWAQGDTFLGRLQIRHRLGTAFLRDEGGHIGYHVVPPARRQGHGSALLAAALPIAAELGLDCVLITCSGQNIGSRKIIESNGGLFQDQRSGKLRYWVPTG
jgi:predicted acetyltransferase